MCQLHGSSLSTKSQHPGHPMTQSLSSATCVICRDSWLPRRSVIPALLRLMIPAMDFHILPVHRGFWKFGSLFHPMVFHSMVFQNVPQFHIQIVRNWRPLSHFWMNAFIISVGLFQQMLVGKSHEIPDVFGLNPQIKPIYIYIHIVVWVPYTSIHRMQKWCYVPWTSFHHINCIPSIIHIKSPWKVEIIHIKCSNPWSFEPPDIEASAASRVRRSPRCCILLPIRQHFMVYNNNNDNNDNNDNNNNNNNNNILMVPIKLTILYHFMDIYIYIYTRTPLSDTPIFSHD